MALGRRPEKRALVSCRHPDDQATGFEVGEFRGVFRVEYPTGD